jgi:hypothetical protein
VDKCRNDAGNGPVHWSGQMVGRQADGGLPGRRICYDILTLVALKTGIEARSFRGCVADLNSQTSLRAGWIVQTFEPGDWSMDFKASLLHRPTRKKSLSSTPIGWLTERLARKSLLTRTGFRSLTVIVTCSWPKTKNNLASIRSSL